MWGQYVLANDKSVRGVCITSPFVTLVITGEDNCVLKVYLVFELHNTETAHNDIGFHFLFNSLKVLSQ